MNKELYKILSIIFHGPDREFARYLRDGFIEDIGFLGSDAVTGFSEFLEKTKDKNDEEFYNLLAVEYTRLFINAIPNVPCPPYESVYREGTVMGDSTLGVLDSYSRAGLKVMENFHDLPDHIAVELEFLYYLMSNENTEAYDSFMREHFSKWVPKFCEGVGKNDRVGFYRNAARVLEKLKLLDEL